MQPSTKRHTTSPQDQSHKVLKYVAHTTFFEHLRNHYPSFRDLAKPDLINLLKSAQLLRICDERSMVISFNQATVCVVIYGQVIVQDKSYTIGKFFIVGQVKVSLSFKEKSLMVMLHKQSIETEMQIFEDYYFKKKLIEKLLPIDLLRLTKKQMKTLVDTCDFRNGFSDEKIVKIGGNSFGILLLLDGTFSVLSKEGVKIGQINLDYFGEEILWEKDYEFCLTAQSVQCRFIFLNRDALMGTFNRSNIDILKEIYNKRVLARVQLQKTLEDNINYTRDFMNRMNLSRKTTVINPQYKSPVKQHYKKQLKFQNVKISNNINNKNFYIPSKKTSNDTQGLNQRHKTQYDDTKISQQTSFQNFQPKLYRDQKAKTQFIFRRRVKSEVTEQASGNDMRQKEDKVADKDVQNLKNLPKTLSVLLKYYESTEKLRPRPKSVNTQHGFVASSKERRIMTTMKLHKQIFMREYFEIKAMEDKAFKTWR